MKNIFTSTIFIVIAHISFSQVTIDIPYENGQVNVVANITYSETIKTADSVSLEACYQSYSDAENPKVFTADKTIKGLPVTITRTNSFESRESLQTYRCIVYIQGKKIVSNEVQIDYNGYKYNQTPLPTITNIQSVIVEKDGKRFITLTWDEVPNAFGYKIGERDWNGAEQYFPFQLGYGGPMSETTTNSFTFEAKSSKVIREYGIIAVNKPDDGFSEIEFSKIASVKVTLP